MGVLHVQAGARDANGYDRRQLVDRPVVVAVYNPQPVDPPSCADPYVQAITIRAKEPIVPGSAVQAQIGGVVRLAVALDDKGTPKHAWIIRSPAVILNTPSIDSAMNSTFRPAVFRCKPVPSGYIFAVEYAD